MSGGYHPWSKFNAHRWSNLNARRNLEKKRIENALDKFLAKRRPPPHIRKELDIGYRLSGQSIELLEIRPQWDDPSIIHQRPFAKATYVRTQDCWKVFWMRATSEVAGV